VVVAHLHHESFAGCINSDNNNFSRLLVGALDNTIAVIMCTVIHLYKESRFGTLTISRRRDPVSSRFYIAQATIILVKPCTKHQQMTAKNWLKVLQ